MGMFDYVNCRVPLPDGWVPLENGLQSKDLDCGMDVVTISADGRLMQRYVSEWLPVPEHDWKYTGSTDVLQQIWHEQSKRRPVYAERDLNFHGWFNFYGSDSDKNWHEYRAKFTDGRLVAIEPLADPS